MLDKWCLYGKLSTYTATQHPETPGHAPYHISTLLILCLTQESSEFKLEIK